MLLSPSTRVTSVKSLTSLEFWMSCFLTRHVFVGPEQDAARSTIHFYTCLGTINACLVVYKIQIHALFKYSFLYKISWKAN